MRSLNVKMKPLAGDWKQLYFLRQPNFNDGFTPLIGSMILEINITHSHNCNNCNIYTSTIPRHFKKMDK